MKNTNREEMEGNALQKPTSIIDYSHNMGGVDLVDQQLDSLNILRKSYKWYKTLSETGYVMCIGFSQTVTRNKERRIISFSFFKMYAPYFFRMHQDWKEIHPE